MDKTKLYKTVKTPVKVTFLVPFMCFLSSHVPGTNVRTSGVGSRSEFGTELLVWIQVWHNNWD